MPVALDAVMAEIGPMDEAIFAVSNLDDGRYIVSFSEVDVEIEHDGRTRRVMLSTVVAPIHQARKQEVCDALLMYNGLWRDTGGVRMALAGQGGDVLQMADLFDEDVTPARLVVVVRNLAERAIVWRRFVAAGEPTSDDTPLELSALIRV